MERTEERRSGVQVLIMSTNLSLPAGAITYPGNFVEMAEAYEAAQELGIKTGAASGYCYMFSNDDCKTVQEYVQKKHAASYYES